MEVPLITTYWSVLGVAPLMGRCCRRGGNLRLQGQVAGDAPGAEGAHGVDAILGDIDADAIFMADGHIAGVVQRIAVSILHSRAGSPDGVGVGLGDAHARCSHSSETDPC